MKRYWLSILLVIFIANIGLLYAIRMYGLAQTCFTKEQVVSDNRCLYIWSNKVFEEGTKSRPHRGHPCGMDVTAIIPGFHLSDMVKYMDPGYLGSICTGAVVPTSTTVPTQMPSETPVPTNTPVPTRTPVPTLEPTLTNTPTPTYTPTPTLTPTSIPTNTPPPIGAPTFAASPTVAVPTETNTPVPTILPANIITATVVPTNASSCTLPQIVTNIRINCGNCLGHKE